ncbi:DUF2857 domain-containing protein [Mannheimia haemolytica]|nr:DUF2857 domain-containing protein [Mannheimia haemolytica]
MDATINLNRAVIGEVIERIERGEIGYCRQLGFAEDELAVIENLTQRELNRLAKSPVTFVSAAINHHTFWQLINNVREDSRQQQIIDRALLLGASSELLREMFNLSSADVSARRKLLGIKEAMGRKPNADEETEVSVWMLWEQYRNGLVDQDKNIVEFISDKAFEALMVISEESGVSLTEVVRLVRNSEKQQY